MTGRRQAIGQVGRDLLARHGGAGARRAATLRRRLSGLSDARANFDDLLTAPAWLRLPQAAQRGLGHRAALFAMGSLLAVSIDGSWLKGLAEIAGDEALDWAREAADPTVSIDPVSGADLDALGVAMLAAVLPPPLRPLLDWAAPSSVDPAIARQSVDRALEAA